MLNCGISAIGVADRAKGTISQMHRARFRTPAQVPALTLALALGLAAVPALAQQGGGGGGGGGMRQGDGASQLPHVSGARLMETVATLRGRKAIGNVPGFTPIVSGREGERLEVIADPQSYRLRLRTVQDNVWAQLSYQNQVNRRGDPADILGASVGTHMDLGGNTVLGALALIDLLDQDVGSGRAHGAGWLVGLYVAGNQPRPNLSYDLAVLAGQGASELDPVGTYSDDVTADRLLVSGNLTQHFDTGPLRITPSLNLKYARESWPAYTDGLGHRFSSETYEFVETRARLRMEYAFGPRSRSPRVDGSISLTGLEDLSPTDSSSRYGAVELGLTLPVSRMSNVRVTWKRDRIGDAAPSTDDVQFRLTLRF